MYRTNVCVHVIFWKTVNFHSISNIHDSGSLRRIGESGHICRSCGGGGVGMFAGLVGGVGMFAELVERGCISAGLVGGVGMFAGLVAYHAMDVNLFTNTDLG